MKEEKTFFLSAIFLIVGSFLVKVIGAFYRVPLAKLIGANGLGIYQMVFPFYTILLTFSSTGVPNALSKLIAEGKNPKKVLYKSIKCFSLIGLVASVTLAVFCKVIAKLQGNSGAYLSFLTLSPSVFFVSIISCFRGYFQGLGNIKPTTISQIIEQVAKVLATFLLLNFISAKEYVLAGVCTFSVTFSEIVACVYVFLKYKFYRNKVVTGDEISLKLILKTVFPIALSSIMIPLSRTIDSFLVINLLKSQTEIATSQYGIYAGGVESLINVPVSICYALSVVAIPIISKNKSTKFSYKLIIYTLILSGFAFLITYFSSGFIVSILYPSLSSENGILMAKLLKISAIQIALLSVLQSLNSVLISKNMAHITPISLAVGVAIKVIVLISFIGKFEIYALAISDITCFLVATIINICYIINMGLKPKYIRQVS